LLLLLQNAHGKKQIDEYKQHKVSVAKQRKRSVAEMESGVGCGPSAESGPASKKLKQMHIIPRNQTSISQDEVDKLIADYVVQEMRPLITVEKPAFKNLIHGLNRNVSIPCRKTLGKRLNARLQKMRDDKRTVFSKVPFVCTTADIWSVNRKSYLGMTAHYIDISTECSVSRISVALSCQRFVGSHTYDSVAAMISKIHNDYGLHVEKITATVTDNASNFGKAFREYFIDTSSTASGSGISATAEEQVQETGTGDDDEAENSDNDVENVEIADMTAVLNLPVSEDMDADTEVVLPHHEACNSHSLSLTSTTDADKACDSDANFKRLYRAALAKCTSIWNLLRRSSKASDAVKKIIARAILIPVPTRWNSRYDALKCILQLQDKLGEICDVLKLPKFKKQELECLEEYVMIMAPIAVAIDRLQGDNVYFGDVFPTLHTVQQKLQDLQQKSLKHAKKFAESMLTSLKTRFEGHLSFSEHNASRIIAAVSHPYFKMRWVPDDKKDFCRDLFLRAAKSQQQQLLDRANTISDPDPLPGTQSAGGSGISDDFFSFSEINIAEQTTVSNECLSYLSDSGTDFIILAKYEVIKHVFVRYNTTLPSSAPVERLFSTAGQIQTPRRNCLSDATFEKLLLLKANKC
jgi:hypothetical protein